MLRWNKKKKKRQCVSSAPADHILSRCAGEVHQQYDSSHYGNITEERHEKARDERLELLSNKRQKPKIVHLSTLQHSSQGSRPEVAALFSESCKSEEAEVMWKNVLSVAVTKHSVFFHSVNEKKRRNRFPVTRLRSGKVSHASLTGWCKIWYSLD